MMGFVLILFDFSCLGCNFIFLVKVKVKKSMHETRKYLWEKDGLNVTGVHSPYLHQDNRVYEEDGIQ